MKTSSNLAGLKSSSGKLMWSALMMMFLAGCSNFQNPNNFVDVFIGTGGHGHTHPSATVPFGMIQPGPVNGTNGWDWVSGYHYSDSVISGFTQTHLSGTGIGDLNDILIQPVNGEIDLSASRRKDGRRFYASAFSHDLEKAVPGYYSVLLNAYDINAEMTATERVAMYRFTYPDFEDRSLLIDLGFSVNWDHPDSTLIRRVDANTLSGYRMSSGWAADQYLYFAMQFSEPFDFEGAVVDSVLKSIGDQAKANEILVKLHFKNRGEKILAKVAISAVSEEGALLNLSTLEGWNFEETRYAAEIKWQKELDKITIKADRETKTKFYTALYHTKLAPVLYSDADGSYRGGDQKIYNNPESNRYSVFSLWDTFRAQHPLLTITDADRVNDLIKTMLDFYKETGFLPVWELHGNETNTMTGYHAIPVILDAYQKGFRGSDAELAFEAMKASAMQDQRDSDLYRQYGYIPSELGVESVTKTLEYAYDDWCIAEMARLLGKDEDHKYFERRSNYWKALYDPDTKFMRGKTKDGKWTEPFDPLRSTHRHSTDYTEGNAWQHSWFVPHNVDALIDRMGGDASFVARLDSMFEMPSRITGEDISPDISGMIGQYAHGNEPSHHIAYLYNYAGTPWKTQYRVRQILDSLYTTEPDGLSGNEDAGQMSAWYVFSALGLYPVNPANGIYVVGTPIIEKAVISLPRNKAFTIEAQNLSKENIYIQSAELNGKPLSKSYITHKKIMNGGALVFKMGNSPNKNWAIGSNSRPPKR
ncbi:GH92 family glycosyl hydrolase [Gracilimonas tropica]|uniref:GH92 family glycosyl hydrolase n=1 Tax=Gracilimonas tropica TaxID=454600 RepID=UPI0003708977|nr:GH92 family glycosyl hydrolase [Gracilimonas tropica]